MAGYDPKKAAAYNKLRQQGLSDEAAFQQSGITDAEADNYVVNDSKYNSDGSLNTNRGQIGPTIFGTGTITKAPTAAEQKESAQFYKGLESNNFERVDYPVKANSQPSNKTPINYTTTSTEQVSGGGSKTITAGVATANDRSTALQAQSDAKSAELKQFLADNPRNANATPEEQAARRAKITELSNERGKLATAAEEAKTPGNPTETTVPNTTTNTSTVTYSQSSTNSDVETTAGPDPALDQTPSLDNTQVAAARAQAAEDPYTGGAGGGGFVNSPLVEPAPQEIDTPLFTPEQSISLSQVSPEPVDAATAAADFNTDTNTSVLTAIGAPADQPDPYDNRFTRQEADAAEAADNESTAETARLNRGEDAAVESATKQKAQEQQALQARFNQPSNGDWRVRIRLAPNSNYLYNDTNPGILAPLKASDGVIFPYTPAIQTSYNANYDTVDLPHSNYRGQFYKDSNVNDISINGIFTAQDTAEAEYMLAVIHFFRSVTKMFYGQDSQRGAPPPLVYLFGLGQYQFNNHPCVVRSFTYNLPTDVDYIRTQPNNYGVNLLNRRTKSVSAPANTIGSVIGRLGNAVDLLGNILKQGALPGLGTNPAGQPGVAQQAVYNTSNATYVPTKIEIQLTLLPIQTRNQVSQQFSLKGYANGDLLRGGFW